MLNRTRTRVGRRGALATCGTALVVLVALVIPAEMISLQPASGASPTAVGPASDASSSAPSETASESPTETASESPTGTASPTSSSTGTTSPTPSSTQPASVQPAKKPAKKKSGTWFRVKAGPMINSATGTKAQRWVLYHQITDAINHSHKGSWIRIMSWNVASSGGVAALIKAQKRGVVVRVLMSRSNFNPAKDVPDPSWVRLRNGLSAGNKGRPKKNWSYAKLCSGSCRGRGRTGQPHAKFYLFSKSGASPKVLMEGSANYTDAASNNQWNDLYTFVNRAKLYDYGVQIFNEMWKDKRAKSPWQSRTFGNVTLDFSPESGPRWSPSQDPWRSLLSQVKCTGAVHGNAKHRTLIRLAPDVMRDDRGMKLAKMLRGLWNKGCDVAIGYTVMSPKIKHYLEAGKRGPIPLAHLVQDFNQDGYFDNYFHLKVMTINGVVGKNKGAYWMIDGSSNNSALSANSDENMAIIRSRPSTLKYQKFINYWITHPPAYNNTHQVPPDAARLATGQKLELPAQPSTVSGWGVLPTGSHKNPYAHVDMD